MYHFFVIFSMITWGSLGIFVTNIPLNSVQIALARTFIGGGFLVLVYLLKKGKFHREKIKKYLPHLIYSGIAIGLNWVFLFEAYRYVSVSVATLTYYCSPAIVVLTSPFILKEKLTFTKLAGVAAAMVGMVIVNYNSLQAGNIKGVVYGLLAAVFYASVTLTNKKIKGFSGLELSMMQLIFSGMILLPYAFFTGSLQAVSINTEGIVYLLIVCLFHTGVCYWLYFEGLQKLAANTVAMCSFIDPVSALVFSAVFLNEKLTLMQIAGALIIIGGAMLSELYKKEKV